ncbi:hypothetical protein NEOLEDRAFT_1088973 [Neolentinus lepideus HHB14362 ss-1]|uniref:SET domain-containing protein n=1 Tax=Neolentinus lepideus HHB14362 ss-1 TaxID=1314782 RepID=A0A165TZ65_9AGAM|nr:hypothetical protein NEOLEDRAFT_1088973 [Neolentinus lepideus HHB14362 ss-1]
MSDALPLRHKAPDHLNSTGCSIRYSEGKGRGVFASRKIDAQTVVEISPVLLFTKDEYDAHGRHTALDHYTFKWPNGRMALALGLGSLFNHSDHPNVTYTLDTHTDSIRYTTTRPIQPDEELCIFYGHKLWFENAEGVSTLLTPASDLAEDDGMGGLSGISAEEEENEEDMFAFPDGDPSDAIDEADLPFERLKLFEDPEEEAVEQVRTTKVWIVDLPEPRQTNTMLKWLKETSLDSPLLSHLKRVRKTPSPSSATSLLLLPYHDSCPPPSLPSLDPPLPQPYLADVPKTAALTLSSCKVKSSLWPTVYAPRRKGEAEVWERGRVRWACEAMRRVARTAKEAKDSGELPIVAYVPIPYSSAREESTPDHGLTRECIAHDTRKSLGHPLKHAVINAIRAVADYRASTSSEVSTTPAEFAQGELPATATDALTPDPLAIDQTDVETDKSRNGIRYLLTSLTLFTTHEPCIMCSMALLHSRVKEVLYLYPMEKTGGCGGATCLPRLEGVNHRFGIGVWKNFGGKDGMGIGGDVDA